MRRSFAGNRALPTCWSAPGKVFRVAAGAATLAFALGGAAAAFATARSVTWTSREDFEGNAPGRPGPTSRANVDTVAQPGSVTLAGTWEGPGASAEPPRLLGKDVSSSMAPELAASRTRGDFLALWVAARGAGQATVIAQRLDAGAKPLGKAVALGDGAAPQLNPCAVSDERSGAYLAAWVDGRNMGTAIFARQLTAAGVPAGAAVLLSEGETNAGPRVAWNSATRESLVVWWTGAYDIHARRVSGRGRPVGPVLRICSDPGKQTLPRVVYREASGDYLVCWADRRAGNEDIRCRAVAADGSLSAPEVPIRTEAYDEILTDVVAGGRGGETLLLWEDYRHHPAPLQNATMGDWRGGLVRSPGSEVDLYAQRLDGSGVPLGPEFPVCGANGNQLKGRAAFLPSARQYLVVWQDGRSGYDNWDVFGRLAGADGALGPEFVVAGQPGGQIAPRVACRPDVSVCLAAWLGLDREGESIGVQRLAGKPGAVGVLGGIRLAAGAEARWARLSWSADLPPGTGVVFRTRSAGSDTALAAAPWSPGLRESGAAIESPPGAWLEIEARLESADGKAAPVLHEFTVQVEE